MTPDKASRESITIVDYGMGNLGSIQNMLKKIGVESLISADPHLISLSKKIILPGVGHFKKGMENIRAQVDLLQALNNVALGKQIPVLGICLGAQLVTSFSEEGDIEGFQPGQNASTQHPILKCLIWAGRRWRSHVRILW